MIIKQLNDKKWLQLITDSQDVQQIDEYIGQEFTSSHGYFVDQKNGGYTEIYVFDGSIPYLEKELVRLK